jgi:hypothetical protein
VPTSFQTCERSQVKVVIFPTPVAQVAGLDYPVRDTHRGLQTDGPFEVSNGMAGNLHFVGQVLAE